MTDPSPTNSPRKQRVRVGKREFSVQDSVTIRKREFFVLEDLNRDGSKRLVCERRGSSSGDLQVLMTFSNRDQSTLHILDRLTRSRGDLPAIYDKGRFGDGTFLLMEYVAGQTLDSYFEEVRDSRKPPVGPRQAFELLRKLLHQLSRIHRAGLHHFDIRPSNLVVDFPRNRIRLIDFGSAWVGERMMIRPSTAGTGDAYSAPELLTPSPASAPDFRADLFSVGVVFYEMITRTKPYGGLGGAVRAVGGASLTPALVPVFDLAPKSTLTVSVRPTFEKLFQSLLALDPDRRPVTVNAVIAQVEDIHMSLRHGDRLSPINRLLSQWLDKISRLFDSSSGTRD